jgi:ferredoxin
MTLLEKLRAALPLERRAAGRTARAEAMLFLPMASSHMQAGDAPTHKKVQRVRAACQTIALFIMTFTAVGHMIQPLLPVLPLVIPDPHHWFLGADRPVVTQYSLAARAVVGVFPLHWALLSIGAVLIFGSLFGRVMCGWACPIGFMQDLITSGRRKLGMKDREPSANLHSRLLLLKYISLGMTLMLSISVGVTAAWDPAAGAAYSAALGPAGGEVPLKFMAFEGNLYAFLSIFLVGSPTFNLLFGLQLALFFIILAGIITTPRFYCRYFCRTGALISLTSKFALLQVRKRQSTCDHVGACLKTCPMGKGQDTYVVGKDGEAEERLRDTSNCVHCYRCVTACPTPTLQVRFGELPVLVPKAWQKEAASAAASGAAPEAPAK